MYFSVYSSVRQSAFHQRNEDAFYVGDNFAVVADGMGGEACGDVASAIAVESIRNFLSGHELAGMTALAAEELMFGAISHADSQIRDYIAAHPGSAGMGTTLLLAVCDTENLHVAWCGDSRCFLFNGGRLASLTKDHSLVQELMDDGLITAEESFTHPDNNVITRYVGGGKDACRPEFVTRAISDGDIYILCSDGLAGYCRPEEIRNRISSNTHRRNLSAELIALALEDGSQDDITVLTIIPHTSPSSRRLSLLGWLLPRFRRACH